jgi:hypothetical protein
VKTLGKIIGGILVCLVLFLLTARITGFEPRTCANIYEAWSCRLPGLWLRGDLVTTPVTDWSFTDAIPTVKLQTHTWYLLPHSVNIGVVYYNGHLYLSSVYMRPDVKYRWNEDVLRDPRVRLKIGDKLYDRTLSYVTDPAEKAAVFEAKSKKYYQVEPLFHGLSTTTTSNVFRVPDN